MTAVEPQPTTAKPKRDKRYDEKLRQRVFDLISCDPDITVRQMAGQLGRSVSRAHALMREVKDERNPLYRPLAERDGHGQPASAPISVKGDE